MRLGSPVRARWALGPPRVVGRPESSEVRRSGESARPSGAPVLPDRAPSGGSVPSHRRMRDRMRQTCARRADGAGPACAWLTCDSSSVRVDDSGGGRPAGMHQCRPGSRISGAHRAERCLTQCRELECRSHDRVGGGQSDIDCAEVVAVDDPSITGDQALLDPAPLVGRLRIPRRVVVERVEVDRRELKTLADLRGEPGLPGPAGTDDREPLHANRRVSRPRVVQWALGPPLAGRPESSEVRRSGESARPSGAPVLPDRAPSGGQCRLAAG